jgi:Mce-associated membrane protein
MTTAGGGGALDGESPRSLTHADDTSSGGLFPRRASPRDPGDRPFLGPLPWPREGGPRYALWWSRVVAWLLDTAILGSVVYLAFPVQPVTAPMPAPFYSVGTTSSPRPDASWTESPWVVLTVVLLALMQAYLGSTPGKLAVGIAVVRDADGRPAGLLRTVGRWVAHLVDAVLCLGYLRAAWHPQGRTVADSLLSTVVVVRRDARTPSWWAGAGARAVVAGACVVSVVAAVFQVGPVGGSLPGDYAGGCTTAVAGPPRAFDGGTLVVRPDTEVVTRWGVTRARALADGGIEVRWESAGTVAIPGAYRLRVARPGGAGARTFEVRVVDAHADGTATLESGAGPMTDINLQGATVVGTIAASTVADLGPTWDWTLTSDTGAGVSAPCTGTVRRAGA